MNELVCRKMSSDGTIFVTTKREFNEDTQQVTWKLSVTASIGATVNGEFEHEIDKLGGEVAFTGAHLMHLMNRVEENADEIQMLAQLNFKDIMEKLSDGKEQRDE